MYMDYKKLWKLLIDKRMSKTDLMELTGISSRVLAKLSKNETVTTDTLARICEALSCDVCDIMEVTSQSAPSLYFAYKKYGVCTAEEETCKTIRFSFEGEAYAVHLSKQSATKATQIHCDEDGTVYWEQFHPIGHIASISERRVLVKPKRDGEETVIVLIKGKPGVITGLDENGFVSARGKRGKRSDVYVMSEAAFKLFSPQA